MDIRTVPGIRRFLLAAVALCGLAAQPAAAQTVDTFTTNQAALTAPPGGASSVSSGGGDIIGMHRGLTVALRSGVGPVTAQVSGGSLTVSVATTMPASRGEAVVTWDGDTNPMVLSPTGLGGANLGSALRLSVLSASAGVELTFTVYTDGANASVYGLVLPAIAAATDIEIPFASFVASAGSGANFASVGAVTLAVRGNGGTVVLNQVVLGAGTPAFTATLTDGVTSARPGDTLDYRLTLSNTGPGAATGVTITDPLDPDTALVPGSVEVSPLALDDQYAGATIGTPFSVIAPGVLTNDVDGDGDLLLVAPPLGPRPTAQGGTATLNGDGSFSYTPPPSFRGLDTFGYQADDNNGIPGPGVVTIHVDCPAISVTPTTLADGVTGTAYGPVQFMATGTTGTVTWSLIGTLPTGMNFSAAGVLNGTPTQSGTFPLTFVATDSLGCQGSQAITLTVNSAPEITSADNTTFTVGVNGSFTLTATGMPTPSINLTGGTPPSAVVYTPGTRTLSGIPGVGSVGAHALQFTATNGINPDDVQDFTLNVVCPTITVNGPALPDGLFNVVYPGATFTQTGSTGSTITWSATGLVTGLGIGAMTGAVTGTPMNTVLNGAVIITATDEYGCQGSANRTLTVRPNPDNESYTGGVGNTQFVVGAALPITPYVFVLDNVKMGDQGPAPLTVTFPAMSPNGTVNEGADGTFGYTPNVGFTGNEVFSYTLTDGNGVTNTATVTINLANLVWYVNSAGGNGDGRSHSPFNRLDNAGTPSASFSTIFVHTGGATTLGNLTLDANQTLWGQGAAFTLNGMTIAAGTTPTLTGTVTLANNTLVNSVNFAPVGIPALVATSAVSMPVTINQVSTTGGTSALSLTNVGGAVTVTNSTFSNGSAAEVLINQGTGNVAIGAAINNNSGRAIDVQSRTSGNVTFSGAITDTNGTGIILNGNGTSTFTFSGGMTLNGASSTFTATNAGTLTITGTNRIGATTPPTTAALTVTNTTIGASGLTFERISAGTAAGTAGNGIVLDTTGSNAGLTVTGTGSAASGGTIQRKTGANGSTTQGIGIYLNRTRAASFSRMQLNDFDNFAIRGNEIDGLTLSDVVVSGVNGNSAADDEGSILLEDAGGTIAISNSNVSGGYEDNLRVLYDNASAGPAAVFNVTGTTFRDLQAAGQNSQVNLRSTTAASSSWNVAFNFTSSCVFENDANTLPPGGTENWSDGILVTFEGPFQHSLNVQNATFHHLFQGFDMASNFSADVNYTIRNNNITFTEGVAAIAMGSGSSSTNQSLLSALIQGNSIGTSGVPQSGNRLGLGIVLDMRGNETAQFTLHGNSIRRTEVNGIQVIGQTAADGDLHLQITNNLIEQIEDDAGGGPGGGGVIYGIEVTTNSPSSHDICLDARNNDSININAFDIRVRQATLNNTFDLEGFAGNGTVAAQVEAFLATQNPGNTTNVRTGGSVVNYTAGNCTTPAPLP